MKVAIIIASTGRPAELGRWSCHIGRQTLKPSAVVFTVASPKDLPDINLAAAGISAIVCERAGLCHQRNVGLSAVLSADVITFFDDDYVPSDRCIEGVHNLFADHPDVVAANGTLLADGINSAGIPYDRARAIVAEHDSCAPPPLEVLREKSGLYGCNMAFRTSAIGEERFDERLPLYAWQEDIDFSARVGKKGRIVNSNAFFGVHQGIKGARPSGALLGYAQIANPLYLVRKGTMQRGEAIRLIAKNVVKNHVRALWPESWIDRLGRCKGNWRAFVDVLRHRDDPSNILKM